jgi:3-oxoacyl-[acyl-carrier-protein] synthase-3
MSKVFITKTAVFLPNQPISNDEMDVIIGLHNGSKRIKNMILRSNGIVTRYYAIDAQRKITHTNAQLVFEAIKHLIDKSLWKNIDVLSLGTTTPDQNLPSQAAMVHGYMGKGNHLEINTVSGACSAGMGAMKYGFLSILSGTAKNAIVGGSERTSTWMDFSKFEEELALADKLEKKAILGFQKEFLRWMLSDGAGVFLLDHKPDPNAALNFQIEWVDGISFADEIETCMYAGAEKDKNGKLIPWSHYSSGEWANHSIFSLKQDVKLLEKHIISKGVESLSYILQKHQLKGEELDYFLPHISSYFFKDKLMEEINKAGLNILSSKLFTNLDKIGNVGAGSIFIMFDEFIKTKQLQKGQKILLSVPESARFNYVYALVTVV